MNRPVRNIRAIGLTGSRRGTNERPSAIIANAYSLTSDYELRLQMITLVRTKVLDDHFRHRTSPISSLAPFLRWRSRHPHAGCRGGGRTFPWVSAKAELLRSRRRYRTSRCSEPDPLRASRGADRRLDEWQRAGVLLWRQHLYVGSGEPRGKGRFLQIHQRDP